MALSPQVQAALAEELGSHPKYKTRAEFIGRIWPADRWQLGLWPVPPSGPVEELALPLGLEPLDLETTAGSVTQMLEGVDDADAKFALAGIWCAGASSGELLAEFALGLASRENAIDWVGYVARFAEQRDIGPGYWLAISKHISWGNSSPAQIGRSLGLLLTLQNSTSEDAKKVLNTILAQDTVPNALRESLQASRQSTISGSQGGAGRRWWSSLALWLSGLAIVRAFLKALGLLIGYRTSATCTVSDLDVELSSETKVFGRSVRKAVRRIPRGNLLEVSIVTELGWTAAAVGVIALALGFLVGARVFAGGLISFEARLMGTGIGIALVGAVIDVALFKLWLKAKGRCSLHLTFANKACPAFTLTGCNQADALAIARELRPSAKR